MGSGPAAAGRGRYARALAALVALGVAAGLATGADGFAPTALPALLASDAAGPIVGEIRAPRTLGAALVGALLGLAGAVAQGLFRNPLADPWLLGSAAGAGLGVTVAVAALASGDPSGAGGGAFAQLAWVGRLGIAGAAFAGALGGVALTLALARGALETLRLLLAGVVVGVLLGALSELVTLLSPAALRGRQSFALGTTAYLGWPSVALLGAGVALAVPAARALARALDALTLGEDSARSLGLALGPLRAAHVALLSLATALAVSQAGLVAFVGLVAPHLVRRAAPGPHAWLLVASAGTGAALLLGADVLARAVVAPEELPVGIVTAVLGGVYLLRLLSRRMAA